MDGFEVGELVVVSGLIGVVTAAEAGTVTVEMTVPAAAVEAAPRALVLGAL